VIDAALITAVTPTSGAAGGSTTVTFTCATTGCQGDGSYLMAAFAPTGQCSTAGKREAAALVTTGAKTLTNVMLLATQAYVVCWFAIHISPFSSASYGCVSEALLALAFHSVMHAFCASVGARMRAPHGQNKHQ
jgi:hypothetical protein